MYFSQTVMLTVAQFPHAGTTVVDRLVPSKYHTQFVDAFMIVLTVWIAQEVFTLLTEICHPDAGDCTTVKTSFVWYHVHVLLMVAPII